MTKFLIAVLLCFMLASCAAPPKRGSVVTAQRMSCSGGRPASITLLSPEEAKLTFQNKNYALKRIQTTHGAKYGNGDISFWNKGIDAMIMKGDTVLATCVTIPKNGL